MSAPKVPCVCSCRCSYTSDDPSGVCWPCRADIARVGAITHLDKIARMRDIASMPEQQYCLCGGTILETPDGIECAACHITAPKVAS